MNARLHEEALNLAAHPLGWPLARLARRLGGVLDVPGVGLVVSDAAFAHEVLTRDAEFTKNGPRSLAGKITELLGPFALTNMDGEAHLQLRRKLNDLVTPAKARPLLLSACEAPIAWLKAELAAGRTVDLAHWMREVSGRIALDMLGIVPPRGSESRFCLDLVALGERLTSGFDFRELSPRRFAEMQRDCAELASHIRVGFESDQSPPSSFVRRMRELGLSFDEAKGVVSLIFLAGTLSTAAAVPRIVALLADTGALPALQRDRARLGSAIAEGLRFTTPVPATGRIASQATTVQGRAIPKDARVVILTCNLSRDGRLFPKPDLFDAMRVHDPSARNLWFGAGPHFCLGFAVAQLEVRMVLEALLDVPGELRIVRRSYARGVVVPAYSRLDIRVAPAST
jgi:cytochrome P450